MGDWSSIEYIISQAFVVLAFAFLAYSYLVKNRLGVLVVLFFSNALFGAGYAFLGAWVGLGLCVIAAVRLLSDYIMNTHRTEADKKRILKIDWVLLVMWIAAYSVVTAFTFDGILSLFALFATLLFLIAAWQKSVLVYRWFGVIVCLLWEVYYIYIENVAGIILEIVLLMFVIFGLLRYIKKGKYNANINEA